ncbi:MAG: RagB/SusD family nutrient uptake outer membrane protein [Marinifilaceae bacterium]|jgi:hypothetical protein|nr:RagB/SusD family nutrient uptake outer membrane protein [Marinifilaceae bacterium]
MKKLFYTIGILLSIFLYSCDSFLEYKAGDKLIPKTAENYKEFLYGEVIKEDATTLRNLEFMTDNVEEGILVGARDDVRKDLWGYYTWQQIPERNYINEIKNDDIWSLNYHKILSCNIVLDNIDDAIGSENEKNIIKAEARFLRAYSYLILANTYAKPYTTEEDAKIDRSGVPINDKSGIEENIYTRSSLYDVYQIIENDLKESIDLFEKSEYTYSVFRPNIDVARLVLSRAFLYQKKYNDCVAVTTALIANTSRSIRNLKDYIGVRKMPPLPPPPPPAIAGLKVGAGAPPPPPPPPPVFGEVKYSLDYFTASNTAILFSYGVSSNGEFQGNTNYFFKASTSLLNSYRDDDYRKIVGWDFAVKTKPWKFKATDMYDKCLRLEEAYLNRAEALAELDEGDRGAADVTYIRSLRMPVNFELPMGDQDKALKAVREEKRREFCFENQRWFDIRRWMDEDITHTYTLGDKVYTYTLLKNSEAYTLPVPIRVLQKNKQIVNVNRPVRNND